MLQKLMAAAAKSYVRAELPKWGAIANAAARTGWSDSQTVSDRNKLFGYETDFDLSKLGERQLYLLGRWSDLPTQLMLTSFPKGTIVDVGANRGDFALAAAYLCERVICFEPNPEMIAFLARDLDRNGIDNVTLRDCGLSDKPDNLTLSVPDWGASGASFGTRAGKKVADLPVAVGDEELAGESPVLIKIDVEGFEVRVIRGLRETVKRARPIIITEVIRGLLESAESSEPELYELMESLGYRGFGIGLVRRGLTHELKLGVPSTDIAWLPTERSPDEFRASQKDLKRLAYRSRQNFALMK